MDFKHIEWCGNAEVVIKKDGETVAVLCTSGIVTGGVNCKTSIMHSDDPLSMTRRVKVEIEV